MSRTAPTPLKRVVKREVTVKDGHLNKRDPKAHLVPESFMLVFVWHGGPYIDISFGHQGAVPFEVINVWDSAAGKAGIEFTQDALAAKVDEWLHDDEDHNLLEMPNYYLNHRLYGGVLR